MNPRVVLLSALLHSYIGLRLVPPLKAWPWAAGLLVVLLIASAALVPIGLGARRRRLTHHTEQLALIGYLLLGLLSSLFVFTFLRDVFLLSIALLGHIWPAVTSWKPWMIDSAVVVPLAAVLVTLLGLWNARRTA